MIEQLDTFPGNTLAIEVIDGFTETDQKLLQKLFKDKADAGSKHVHLLVKLDELKIQNSSIKAFMEDIIWELRTFQQMGHLAIVAHSNILKAYIPFDNLFFQRASKDRMERYFDISQMDEAMAFVTT